MQQKHFIDSHKGATFFYVLALIIWFDRWDNTAAMLYLALHGSYGFFWVLKSRNFSDKQWEQPCSALMAAKIWIGLSLYWITPWLICYYNIQPPTWYLAACVFAYCMGVFWHFASDMQKFMWIKLNAGNLLTTGLWARVRNPNYFGELLIYGGFSALAMHWIPFVALAIFVFGVWVPNMLRKDKSLSRYAEFAEYKQRSTLFIPFVV